MKRHAFSDLKQPLLIMLTDLTIIEVTRLIEEARR